MTAKQDDADSLLIRHIRTAMKAIDKIAATEIGELERVRALNRIEAYTLVAGRRVCGIDVPQDTPQAPVARPGTSS